MHKVTLNNKTYYVNEGEFSTYKYPQPGYENLSLRRDLGLLERKVGLINELLRTFDAYFINIGSKYGNYIPINVNTATILDSLDELDPKKIYICNYNTAFDGMVHHNTIVIASTKDADPKTDDFSYPLVGTNIVVYIPNKLNDCFKTEFRYYFDGDKFIYDNLINLCIMVKDAGDSFGDVLKANLPFIDHWTILDTGSTDNTVQIINKTLKCKKGNLYCEPFINFMDSRNRCLDLAGTVCKYNIMLDDTYILKGDVRKFLSDIRSDQYATSYNIFINTADSAYGSNRITRSADKLRYKHKMHEIIDDTNNKIVVQIPLEKIWIHDIDNDYMINRTNMRKKYDIQLLKEAIHEEPDNPRHLYYLAQTYFHINKWSKAIKYYQKRTEYTNGYEEEVTDSYLLWAFCASEKLNWGWEKCEELYIKSFESNQNRPDALYFVGVHYLNSDSYKAYQYLKTGFELGTPINSTFNLRLKLYNYHLPMVLIPLCFQFRDYHLGERAFQRLSAYTTEIDQTTRSYNDIFILMNKRIKIKRLLNNGPILCFVARSPTVSIVEFLQHTTKTTSFQVYLFSDCKEQIIDGVEHMHMDIYVDFIDRYKIHTSIVSQLSEYLYVTLSTDIDNVHFIVDGESPISGNIIPTDYRLRTILCESPQEFLEIYPVFSDRVQKVSDLTKLADLFGEYLNDNLDYAGMLNWSSDIPKHTKQPFVEMLDLFRDTQCKILEIGTFAGTSVINMLRYLPRSTATVIDMWEDYDETELLKNISEHNVKGIFHANMIKAGVEDRVTVKVGDSKDVLLELVKQGESYDLVYVDGSHKCLDCYNDMTLSWGLLSVDGVLAIDDYLWRPANIKNEYLERPFYAVEHFIEKYSSELEILHKGYRVFLRKL